MKKFWLTLGLTLMLVCWCGEGYLGFGTGAAFGQEYYSDLSCNPRDPYCYNEYYAAPYAPDPLSQFLYYVAPPVERDYRYERRESNRERRDREREDRRERRRY